MFGPHCLKSVWDEWGGAATSLLDREGLEKRGSSGFRHHCRDKVRLVGASSVKEMEPHPSSICAAQTLGAGIRDSSLCFLLCLCLCVLLRSIAVPWRSNAATLSDSRGSGQGGEDNCISPCCLERLKIFLWLDFPHFQGKEVRRRAGNQSQWTLTSVFLYTYTEAWHTWEHTLTHTYTEVCMHVYTYT